MHYEVFFSYLGFTESKFACVESRLSKKTHKSFLHFLYNIIINKSDLTIQQQPSLFGFISIEMAKIVVGSPSLTQPLLLYLGLGPAMLENQIWQ
jgi:hypothetical protein